VILISRCFVGLIGLMSLLALNAHWLRVDALAAERGIQAVGLIGAANIRADVGGLFLAIGLFALVAAWKRSQTWLLATILLPSCALLGRFVSLALDGYDPRMLQPIIVELVVIGLLTSIFFYWRKMPEGL
jgi:uncharacterized membrane protein (UPF0136 family)